MFDVEKHECGGDDVADHARVEADVSEGLERHLQDGVCLFGAGSGVCLQPVELLVLVGECGALGFLDRQVKVAGSPS